MSKQIPKTTKNRYPHYLRALRVLKERGYERVVSSEIAREMGILATTVRKDFSYLDKPGQPGQGYLIDYLIEIIRLEIGNGEIGSNSILIGVGNMGKALLKYNHLPYHDGKIIAAYESDITKLGFFEDVPVYHISQMRETFPSGVKIAIVAIPKEDIQEICDELYFLGVRIIINFSNGNVKPKKNLVIQKIDLIELIQDALYKYSQQK